MSDISQAKNLLKVAQRDLKALAGMLDADVFADEIFGFHIQQAAEKLLKAWLAALGRIYPLTHSLELLLQLLEDLDCDVAEYRNLADFAPFAVQLRYADMDLEDSPVDREDAIAQVKVLYRRIEAVINDADTVS